MLILPIKKQWFDMIAKGQKWEEYRTFKPYYKKRFQTIGLLDVNGYPTGKKVIVGLRNGYSNDSPTLITAVTMSVGLGLKKWGAVNGEVYYILNIVDKKYIQCGDVIVVSYPSRDIGEYYE